ncbi:hypothetical protein LSUE1_G002333, partial [Lachnellula suecica]
MHYWWLLLASACVALAQDVDFAVGQKFQIILSAVPNLATLPLVPADAPVWDIDLWDSDNSTIAGLKALGKIVICYFSAGTSEDWRPDYGSFAAADKGSVLPEWKGENWLRLGSANVRAIMAARIQMAASKGCDAIDPDNTDGYFEPSFRHTNIQQSNTNSLNLQMSDSIDFMKFLVTTAASYGLKTGLKNSLQILPNVMSIVDFAVNEQCGQFGECAAYVDFIASAKPVFHIEYPAKAPTVLASEKSADCTNLGVTGLSTVLKELSLAGWVGYCDGSQAITNTKPGSGGNPWTTRPPPPTTRPTSTSTSKKPTTTTTAKPTTTRTTTSSAPTTTPGGGTPG